MPDDLCVICGAYWQCDCGSARIVPGDGSPMMPNRDYLYRASPNLQREWERLNADPQQIVQHLEAVRDEYRQFVIGAFVPHT